MAKLFRRFPLDFIEETAQREKVELAI